MKRAAAYEAVMALAFGSAHACSCTLDVWSPESPVRVTPAQAYTSALRGLGNSWGPQPGVFPADLE